MQIYSAHPATSETPKPPVIGYVTFNENELTPVPDLLNYRNRKEYLSQCWENDRHEIQRKDPAGKLRLYPNHRFYYSEPYRLNEYEPRFERIYRERAEGSAIIWDVIPYFESFADFNNYYRRELEIIRDNNLESDKMNERLNFLKSYYESEFIRK